MKHVIVENHVPYIQGLLEPFAQVTYLPADEITPQAVRLADALVVRTRTRCGAALLAGSRVSFIGTATIGTDHIDLDYCRSHGIEVANAPGCNAPAVAQWVHATLGQWLAAHPGLAPNQLTLGIVGVGHVGSIVARWARQLGYRVLLNDPPRAAREGAEDFVSLEQVLDQAHIITFHTPLTRAGQWPTWHLCDLDFLARARHCRLLVNAARGPITSTQALLGFAGDLALDCWEGEPHISPELLQRAFVATPHIAGYSADGKRRGTAMVVEAMNRHFGWQARPQAAHAPSGGALRVTLPGIMATYNPLLDTQALKQHPEQFEALRNHYPLRQEVF